MQRRSSPVWYVVPPMTVVPLVPGIDGKGVGDA